MSQNVPIYGQRIVRKEEDNVSSETIYSEQKSEDKRLTGKGEKVNKKNMK